MQKPLMMLIIGLFFGTGFGFVLAASSGAEFEGHDHSNPAHHTSHSAHDGMDHDAHAHHDSLTEVTGPAPTLAITLHSDGANSRNLHIATTNFAFAPEAVNGAHVEGEGHAHVYVNGVKLARAYSPWQQLHGLGAGEHKIRVTLNANDHSALAVNGEAIEATATLVIE